MKPVEECDVNFRPECVPSPRWDGNVCIQRYYAPGTWCAVTSVVDSRKVTLFDTGDVVQNPSDSVSTRKS